MTINELYKWAKAKGVSNYPIVVQTDIGQYELCEDEIIIATTKKHKDKDGNEHEYCEPLKFGDKPSAVIVDGTTMGFIE